MSKARRTTLKSVFVSLKFSKRKVKLIKRGEYTTVGISRGISIGNPGEPYLPWQRHFIYIPPGAKPSKLSVESYSKAPLANNVVLEPCQVSEPTILGNATTWTEPNVKLYRSAADWPKKFAVLSTTRHSGGFCMVEVLVCPFCYKAATKKLELIDKVRLKLTYRSGKMKIIKTDSLAVLNHHKKFAKRVAERVLNPSEVKPFYEMDVADLTPFPWLLPTVECVIVTDTLLASPFQRLSQWRTWMGVRTRVVTIADIVAGTVPDTGGHAFWASSGFNDGGTRDEAEAIRNFIKWAAVHWGTDYVLLGGDNEIIPERKGLHSGVGTVNYGVINAVDTNRELANFAIASSEVPGSGPGNVLDENPATIWQCAGSDASPWIRLEMLAHTPINRIVLEWGSNHAASYDIEVSHDGTTWTNVHSTNSGTGGTEQVDFACCSGRYLRVSFPGGPGFIITGIKLYGPRRSKWNGIAYSLDATTTRIYIGWAINMLPNPANSVDGDQIVIKEGPSAGTIIPYDPAASSANLGWRFVQDLPDMPGNVSNVSTRFIEIRGPVAFHNNSFVLKRDYNYIPADLYYSDIEASEYPGAQTHDWDADDNGIYGERFGGQLDAVNGIADVYLGRAPVETVDEVNNFIDKVIRYERYQDVNSFLYPMDFAVSVLLGSQDWAAQNTVGVLDGSAQGKENIRATFRSYDPNRWKFTRRYQDHADVPAADQGPDLAAADTSEILNAIREGNHVVSLSSHGSSNYLCYINGQDVDDVVNIPSIFYGNACSTNRFDGTGAGEAISELTILNINGGAVAYAGNSRFGWTGDNPMEHEFWEQHLTAERLGEMFNACKLILLGWQSYSMNLLGDPVMRVWSDRPIQISVNHPAEIETGSQSFAVTVIANNAPVANAAVTLVMDDTLFATSHTDATGTVQFSIAPSQAGTMRVTVCGKNLLPYLGSVTITQAESDCRLMVSCPRSIVCHPTIGCNPLIGCAARISCIKAITCRAAIQCGQLINCQNSILCRSTINCVNAITCGANIACSRSISCRQTIACPRIDDMCPTITPRPDDFFREYLMDRWGVRDFSKLSEVVDPADIETAIDRLPDTLKRPYREMLKKLIRKMPK
jgi:hypothetical protein